jgi:hypothetical protein
MAAMTPAVNPFETQNIEPDIPVAVTPNNVFATEQPAITPQDSTPVKTIGTTWSPASSVPPNNSNLSSPRKKNLGLSELSKQLRALQAKNEIQSVEIDRLERQLKILADLHGISVADLRGTLQRACESEAHHELQQRIASLQAQLEAATLSSKPQTVKHDSSSHRVANLELRVGELEEVEENQRKEISRLYEALKEQTTKATRLESTCSKQHCEIERMRQKQEAQQEAQLIPVDTLALVPVQPQVAAAAAAPTRDIIQYQTLSTAIVASSADMQLLAETARLAEVEAQVGHDKLSLLEQQLDAAETQYKLKQAQFKARSMVQDERMEDLEQQLSSLYVAFELLRQERSEEDLTRAALQSCLRDADSQVAQQVDDRDRLSTPQRVEMIPVVFAQETDGEYSSPPVSPHPVPFMVASSPVSSRHGMTSPPLSRHGSMTSPSPSRQSSAILQSPQQRKECIMAGPILLKSNDILRRWKKRHASLHALLPYFELTLSSTDDSSTKVDKIHQLHVGVSTVYKYATQRCAFIVRVDPYDNNAPVIYAAATNEQDYHRWMSALTLATTGNEYNTRDYNMHASEAPMYGTPIERLSSLDEQEASELEAALRLSIAEK